MSRSKRRSASDSLRTMKVSSAIHLRPTVWLYFRTKLTNPNSPWCPKIVPKRSPPEDAQRTSFGDQNPINIPRTRQPQRRPKPRPRTNSWRRAQKAHTINDSCRQVCAWFETFMLRAAQGALGANAEMAMNSRLQVQHRCTSDRQMYPSPLKKEHLLRTPGDPRI